MWLIEKKGKILIEIVMIFLWTTRAEKIQIFYFRKLVIIEQTSTYPMYGW